MLISCKNPFISVCKCVCAWTCTVWMQWITAFVSLNTHQIFQPQKCGWLSLSWQPSSLQSRHWRRNTPPHKLCQWGYARLRRGVFVNRDIQVKKCLFTKQLFFPLQCKRRNPRPADQLQKADWLPGSHHWRWNPASRKSCTLGKKEQEQQNTEHGNSVLHPSTMCCKSAATCSS